MFKLEKTHVYDVYDKISKDFSNSRSYKWKSVIDFLNSVNTNNSIIADIGCGNGKNVLNLQTPGIFCLDTCLPFLDITKDRGFESFRANLTNIPFRNSSIDIVLCVAAFHHLSTKDRRITALNEIKRILMPGGKVFLTVWSKDQPAKTRRIFDKYGDNYVDWKNSNSRYYYIFEIHEIKSLFENVGLNIINHYWDCGNEVFILNKS